MGERNLDSTEQTLVDASNQKQQQQTLAGKQQYPSYSATTPAWGDRIVKKQLAEDKNNDSGVSSDHWNDNSPGSERSFITLNFLSSPESSISQEASAMPKNNNKFELMSRHGGYKNCRSPDEFSSYRETVDDRPEESTNGLSAISSDYDVKLMQNIKCSICDFSTMNKFKLMEHLTDHCAEFRSSPSNPNSAKVVEQLRSLQEENSQGEHSKQFNNEETEEPGLRTPRVNAQGKVKTFRCKQCNFTAITKLDFWQHSRVHIKVEKLLTCPKCPFVTEYKHHLEYHMHNHVGSKPFKCDQCSYSCVNKSMLNSHMKSHSNVYQYRCADCTYVTKYCHSLKLHLRKYVHNPAMVLNADGTPNPGPIIDVYGTRRGPKQRPRTCTVTQNEAISNTGTSIDQSNDSSNGNAQVSLIAPAQQSLTFQMVAANGTNSVNEENPSGASQSQTVSPYIYDQLLTAFKMSNQLLLHENGTYRSKTSSISSVVTSPITPTNGDLYMSQELIEQTQEVLDYDIAEPGVSDLPAPNFQSPDIKKEESKSEPLDLSKSSLGTGSPGIGKEDLRESATSSSKIAGTSRRRKGIAIKLEHRLMMDDTDEETVQNEKSCESPAIGSFDSREVESANDEAVAVAVADNWLHNGHVCRYCEISFRNEGMYTVHMGYHGFQEPYTCNLCGLNCVDKMSFYLHINRRTGHM